MGTYKLLAMDMDGTVLTQENLISAENREAIFYPNSFRYDYSTRRAVT